MNDKISEKQRIHNLRVECKRLLKSQIQFMDEYPASQLEDRLTELKAYDVSIKNFKLKIAKMKLEK